MKELIIKRLEQRGVSLREVADLVYRLQRPYDDELTIETCITSVDQVLNKREVQYTLLTGIALDKLTEEGDVEEPLASIIECDEPLYGVDESLALAIANIYGTIGFTSFGYLDKNKVGILKKLDSKNGKVNTFLDDLIAGIAAAAAARIAHQKRSEEEAEEELTQKEVS
ncbi:phosphatidylglycerophosphatase A [Natroniella acetigena]|uniref:phosphatidylglycerophosphatase A family protein n=1 Tax=Natroniella acetigena TaxID=52004 RepID=UPI00200AD319|nr:phosphatidylglycerophosphatase A [Natroniella acetigena]MCK8828105.1 phosphatidylglycerophosphatase A [Natroniella acetigena]